MMTDRLLCHNDTTLKSNQWNNLRESRRLLNTSQFSKGQRRCTNQKAQFGEVGRLKRPVQQGHRQRETRGVSGSPLGTLSNKNVACEIFQHPAGQMQPTTQDLTCQTLIERAASLLEKNPCGVHFLRVYACTGYMTVAVHNLEHLYDCHEMSNHDGFRRRSETRWKTNGT